MRGSGRRFRFLGILVGLALTLGVASRALAAEYAAIVMDMRDGTVLYETGADRRQAPASLTKMMTLYLTFEAVRNGQISLDQQVRVSAHAASMPPSKLYLKAGQKVSIRSLIRAAAIKSANDAAVALAEAVGGSEPAFAQLMTARARQLGMKNTTFRNSTGLTAPGHVSSARDMATLGRHLFFDFPQYYNIFSRKSERAAGKRIWTTNRLLSSYPGADGIKTGYTAAAGYNLVASAHRGDKRIIAALFGGKSSRWRNARMVQLLDKGFAAAPVRVAMVRPGKQRTRVAEAPLPVARPGAPATGLDAIAEILTSQAVAATPPSDSALAPLYSDLPRARPGSGRRLADAAEALAPRPGMPVPVPRPSWAVALGTYDDQTVALARLTEVALGDVAVLASAEPVIDPIRSESGTLYQVRFEGLAPRDASRACHALEARGRSCTAVGPQG